MHAFEFGPLTISRSARPLLALEFG